MKQKMFNALKRNFEIVFMVSFWATCLILYLLFPPVPGEHGYAAPKLKEPAAVPTTNGQLVQQLQVIDATDLQIRQVTDSIFKLKEREIKKIKKAHRAEILSMSLMLKDTITARYTDTGRPDYSATPCDSLRKLLARAVITPKEYRYHTDSLQLHGFVLPEGVTFDQVFAPNTMYTRDLVLKKGFLNLGRDRYTQVYNTNPLWRVDSMAVYQVRHRASWWHRVGKPAAAAVLGATATFLILKQ